MILGLPVSLEKRSAQNPVRGRERAMRIGKSNERVVLKFGAIAVTLTEIQAVA